MRSAVIYTMVIALASLALAWHHQGHEAMSRAAAALLPDDVPLFFRQGGEAIARASLDPDAQRHRGMPQLRSAEAPEHFFDLELLNGADIPPTRYELLAWCGKHDIAPNQLGMAPYAIVENTQRLTLALAEYRRWPDDLLVQSKCLHYAGRLAHYAQDLCMPLHTTIQYDGRLGPDGRTTHTGIHEKIDALAGKITLDIEALRHAGPIEPLNDLFAGVLGALHASHALVDRAYELEAHYPAVEDETITHQAVRAFATERNTAAARLTAQLFLTAWRQSADLPLETWMEP